VPTFEELTYYAGILGILALALAFVKSDRLTWFYVILMIFGILVAMGSYGVVHRLLYNILPPFRLMRAPARAAFLFFFSASALTAHVLSKWMSASEEERLTIFAPNLRRIILIFSIIGVVSIAAIGAVFISIHPTETSGRLWHQLGGSAFAVTLVLLSGGLLYLLVVRKPGSIYQRLAVMAALLVILLVDLWTFSYKFVRTDPTGPDQLWLDAKEIIGETNSGVLPWGLSIFTQNGGMQTGLRSVFGYNSLSPGDHLALASSIPDPRSTAYDVLATEYVISEAPLDQFTAGDSGLILVDQTSSVKVYKRPSALAVSRIVYDFEVIPDSQEAIQRIHSSEFDASTTVILARKPGCDVTGSSGESSIEESSSGYWRIRSSSDGPGLLILAENAYPGWRAKIDGQDAEILTAYTSLKVVCVPAGDHIVEWNMTAGVLPAGIAMSLGSCILVIIATVMVLKHRSNAPEESSN
jgi:hypothetical protein